MKIKKAKKFLGECGGPPGNPPLYIDIMNTCGGSRQLPDDGSSPDSPSALRAEYLAQLKQAEEQAAKREKDFKSGKRSTKYSFDQELWKNMVRSIACSVIQIKTTLKYTTGQMKNYKKLLQLWKKAKADPEKIKYGEQIIAALERKNVELKKILPVLEKGEGVWWNVTIPIENGKTFLV